MAQPITEVIDPITRFYKESLTLPFPSFHLRNLVSGHWMNLASNEVNTLGDIAAYKRACKQATSAVKDPVKNRAFLDEMVVQGVLPMDFKAYDVDVLTGKSAYPVPKDLNLMTPGIGQIRTLGNMPGEIGAIYNEARNAGGGRITSGFKAAAKGRVQPGARQHSRSSIQTAPRCTPT